MIRNIFKEPMFSEPIEGAHVGLPWILHCILNNFCLRHLRHLFMIITIKVCSIDWQGHLKYTP